MSSTDIFTLIRFVRAGEITYKASYQGHCDIYGTCYRYWKQNFYNDKPYTYINFFSDFVKNDHQQNDLNNKSVEMKPLEDNEFDGELLHPAKPLSSSDKC